MSKTYEALVIFSKAVRDDDLEGAIGRFADELQKRPLTLLCSSFGLGLTWGTMVLRTNRVKVLKVNHMQSLI